jgi:hypothetical protein
MTEKIFSWSMRLIAATGGALAQNASYQAVASSRTGPVAAVSP